MTDKNTDSAVLKQRYDELAESLDYKITASDFQLRELEIDTASECMKDGHRTLDVGCGLGYAVTQYAMRANIEAHGIDYSEQMVANAQKMFQEGNFKPEGSVQFKHASVLELPYPDGTFDVITSSRCLMALLDWDKQQEALVEICRVLKPGGRLVLMEGTHDGLERLNEARGHFGLDPIAADGRDRLYTLKFRESELLDFCSTYYELERTQRFGMYYFISRIIQPLFVHPDKPRYDHKLNEIAYQIAKVYPDFNKIGHLVAFVLRKK